MLQKKGTDQTRRKSHYPWTKDGGQVTSSDVEPRVIGKLYLGAAVLSQLSRKKKRPMTVSWSKDHFQSPSLSLDTVILFATAYS